MCVNDWFAITVFFSLVLFPTLRIYKTFYFCCQTYPPARHTAAESLTLNSRRAAVYAVITAIVAALRFPFSFTPHSRIPSNVLTRLLQMYQRAAAVSVLSKTNRHFVRRFETAWTSENVAQRPYFRNIGVFGVQLFNLNNKYEKNSLLVGFRYFFKNKHIL